LLNNFKLKILNSRFAEITKNSTWTWVDLKSQEYSSKLILISLS
jgi:hypothetical protein